MAITPTGAPSWVRNASHETYGGDVNKTNYQSQGVVNALTDVGAEEFVRMAADMAAVTRTMPFAVITYLSDDTGTNNPTVEYCALQTGIIATNYSGGSPPTGFPSVQRSSDGVVTITFASSYTDPYGVAGAFEPSVAAPNPTGTTAFDAHSTIAGQVVTVRATSGGTPATDKRVTVSVW